MSIYIEFKCTLSDNQKEKIKTAYTNKESITIDVIKGGRDTLGITNRQVNKIKKTAGDKVRLTLSKTQLQRQGGFLGALLKVLIPVAKQIIPKLATEAAKGAANAGGQKLVKIITGEGLKLTKSQTDNLKKGKKIITLTDTQLTAIKQGGFLGTLGTLALSLIPSVIGAIAGKGQGLDNLENLENLKEIEKLDIVNKEPLTNVDIENMIPGVQVFSKDMLPEDIEDGCYVINLQNYFDGNGSHWTALFKNDKDIDYFDSFGVQPPTEVIDFIGDKMYLYNSMQYQPIYSVLCGYYCVHYLRERAKGTNPDDITFSHIK